MKLLIDLDDEVYNNFVVKNEYTRVDVIAVHNALMGAIRIPEDIDIMQTKGGFMKRYLMWLAEKLEKNRNMSFDLAMEIATNGVGRYIPGYTIMDYLMEEGWDNNE